MTVAGTGASPRGVWREKAKADVRFCAVSGPAASVGHHPGEQQGG
jgi:hypothetical protein